MTTTASGPGQTSKKEGWINKQMLLSMHLPAISIGFGLGATVVVIPKLTQDLGEGMVAAMMVFILQQLGTAVAPLPTGYLIDRIGRRKMLLAGPVLISLSSLLIVRVIVQDGSFMEILFYRFFGGIGEQMWMLSRLTVIADTSGSQQRGKQITSMFGVQQIGNLTGPIVGGLASVAVGLWLPFAIHSVIVILGVLPSFFIVKETMSKPSTTSAGATPSFTAGGAAIDGPRRSLTMADLRTPPIPHVFLAQFLANVTRGGIFGGGVIVVYAAYGFGLSELEIGGLRSAMSLIGIPVVFGAGYIMDRYGRKFTIVPGLALSGLAMAFLALTDALAVHVSVFIAAFITVHFCVSLISGNMQTLGTDVAPPHARGAFFGVSRQIAQTGSLASPVSFTFLVSTFSYAAAFSFLAATAIAASMVVFFGIPETLRKEPKAAVAIVPDSAGIGTSGTS
jgi:MFS family permease